MFTVELLEWVSRMSLENPRKNPGILPGRRWVTAAKRDPFLPVIAITRVVKKASKRM